jgi:molecular chaperone GrpE
MGRAGVSPLFSLLIKREFFMFRDYDEFGRPLNRQPYPANTLNIARRPQGYGRPAFDPREAMTQMQKEVEKARAEAAAWQEEAQKWHTAVKQREAEVQTLQRELAQARQAVARLETETRQAETSDAESWQEKYMRLAADMENSKKRLAQRYAQEAAAETENVLRDMLTVADNLERALVHAAGTQAETGIALTLKAFTAVMQQHGVQPIAAQGQPFDPALHEAVGTTTEPQYAPSMVTAVVETGYRRGEKLLRPARVLVAAGAEKEL